MTNEMTGMVRTNVLEGISGTIRIGNRWPRKNQNKGPPDLPDDFRFSERVQRCLDALQVLQFKRNQYLLGETLAVPLQFLHDSLPYMVQRDVNILQPIHEDIWTTPFEEDEDGRGGPEVEEFVLKNWPMLSGRRYQFWPVDINREGRDGNLPHWGLIVLQLKHVPNPQDDPRELWEENDEFVGPFNYLSSYAVITPDHGSKARALENDIANMLLKVLPLMGVGVGPESTLNAPQITPKGNREHWSSGLRVFEMIRIWLERISELYCYNPHGHDPIRFWAALPGWINVDAIRSNMIGLSAEMVNRSMNNTTRIAIEPMMDYEMQNTHTGEVIPSQTKGYVRQGIGAFLSGQPRSAPVWLEDTPFDAPVIDDLVVESNPFAGRALAGGNNESGEIEYGSNYYAPYYDSSTDSPIEENDTEESGEGEDGEEEGEEEEIEEEEEGDEDLSDYE
ncbi:hypothetical protein F5Y10DRAFT_287564 [Nemania abortiva]|nr:hypothetical protein F5Y10DRAFT_287564 [Nemania abortiva]